MKHLTKQLLTLSGIQNDRQTVFKFCDSVTPREVVFDRLLDGTYKRPFMIEEFGYRSLCFALDGSAQSEMRIEDPYELVSEYAQKMMGFLAFQPHPQRLLMVGLGGGSIVKYCRQFLPSTRIQAVEIDADVIALRSHFFIPPDDERLNVIHADGASHLAEMATQKDTVDAILVDAYDPDGIAPAVFSRSFIEHAKQVLGRYGVLVVNVLAEAAERKRYIAIVRRVFEKAVIIIDTQLGGNVIVFASRAINDPQRLGMAIRNAERNESRLGISTPTLIQRLTELSSAWGSPPAAQ